MSARLFALGGLGEFGANSLLIESEDGDRLLIDAGATFASFPGLGVGYEIPDFTTLADCPPTLAVLTHAHDDHIKGAPLLHTACPDTTFVGTPSTLAWLQKDIEHHRGLRMTSFDSQMSVRGGDFIIDALPVSHSIPGTVMLRIKGACGTAVLATDFRLAPSALGETTSQEALASWGDEGVDLLFLDSTNGMLVGDPPAESTVAETLIEQVRSATGAVFAVSFASHIGRFVQLARAAVAAGRVVVPIGRGLRESLEVHGRLHGLTLPVGLIRPAHELASLPRDGVLVALTGSQGESRSAFSLLSEDSLPGIRLQAGDLLLHAARTIPGNERRLADLFDHCVRQGVRVVTVEQAPIHATGHPPSHELASVISLVRPKIVVPIHGRRRQQHAVAALALDLKSKVLVADNGEELEWQGSDLTPTGEKSPQGRLLFSDQSDDVLDFADVLMRQRMAREGMVVATVAYSPTRGESVGQAEIHFHGFSTNGDLKDTLTANLANQMASIVAAKPETDYVRSTITKWLKLEIRRRTRRRPVVMTMVVEI